MCPVLDFFARYGLALGLLMFAFIGTYRLTDFTMGAMANPFYLDLGFTLKQIAAVAKVYGTVWTVAGILVGGFGGGAARTHALAGARQRAGHHLQRRLRHPGGARRRRASSGWRP